MTAKTGQSPIEDYIERAELARQLGKSVRTLDRWHCQRTGPTRTRVGRSIFYKKSAVATWLEAQTEELPR